MKAGLQQKRFQTIKAGLSPEVRPRSVSCTPGAVGRAGQPPPQGTGKESRRYGCGRRVLSTPICKGVFFLFQQIMKIEIKKKKKSPNPEGTQEGISRVGRGLPPLPPRSRLPGGDPRGQDMAGFQARRGHFYSASLPSSENA